MKISTLPNHENIETEALNFPEQKMCRICFDSSSNRLISPCNCKGSSQFTHEDCLKKWILLKFSDSLSASCEVCKSSFKVSLKFKWKLDLKRGLQENFRFCCSIPIIISVIMVLVIIDGILISSNKIDFEKDRLTSGLLLFFMISSIFGSGFILIYSLKKALFYKTLKDLVIFDQSVNH